MKRWGIEPKKENTLPKSHLVLGVLAVLGFGIILVGLALPVFSAPSSFNNPTTFGHDPGDISSGSFFGANPATDRWVFPGSITVRSILTLVTSTEWYLFVDASTSFLGLRSSPSGPTLFAITPTGSVGIGTTTPAQKLDGAGQIHASGDICTDASGGQCLSQISGTISSAGWTSSCFPAQCESNFGAGTLGTGDLENDSDGIIATPPCPANTKVVMCTGGIIVYGSGQSSKGHVIYQSGNGCNMIFDATNDPSTEIGGYVKVHCAPIVP